MMTFSQSLIITVVDKGMLALVVLIAGYFVNKAFEGYKVTQLRETELLKLRLGAMHNFWSELARWGADCDELVREYMNTFRPGEMHEKIYLRSMKLNEILDQNRFFAGNDFLDDCVIYYRQMMDYYQSNNADGNFDCTARPRVPDVLVTWEKLLKND